MNYQFEGRERFFIITAGRTGSTTLCSILASAGADFGMPASQSWDEICGGSFEHPTVVCAAHHFRLAYEFAPRRPSGPRRWMWSLMRALAKRNLRNALQQIHYVKAVNLDLAVQMAFKLGYFPRIIVNHRPFPAHALSLSQMYTHRTVDTLEADYLRTYRNALIHLHLYGGCVVSYDDLIDPDRTAWLTAVSTVTELHQDHLLPRWRECVRSKSAQRSSLPPLTAESERLASTLDSLSGHVIPPSAQALRNWQRKHSLAELPPPSPSKTPAPQPMR